MRQSFPIYLRSDFLKFFKENLSLSSLLQSFIFICARFVPGVFCRFAQMLGLFSADCQKRQYLCSLFEFQLRSIFVVLSDDMFRQILRKFEKNKKGSGPRQEASGSAPPPPDVDPATDSVPVVTPQAPDPSGKGSKSRSAIKRGASSDAIIPNAKK